MMEALRILETWVYFYKAILCNMQEDSHIEIVWCFEVLRKIARLYWTNTD
jgi:hypothetical protein